jgi:hypothetical protein
LPPAANKFPLPITNQLSLALNLVTFRRTHSTLLRQLHVNVKVQQTVFRHADIRTTMDIYTDSTVDDSIWRGVPSRTVAVVSARPELEQWPVANGL